MRFVQAILIPRTTESISARRRSRVALSTLGIALAASIVPGVATASHGRPHPETYLEDLQQRFAIEYPGATVSQPMSSTILNGLQQRLAIEYPTAGGSDAFSVTLFDARQRQLAIEY